MGNPGDFKLTSEKMSEHFTKEITVKSRMSKTSKDGFEKGHFGMNVNLSWTISLLYSNF